jgi:hypothetical protein
MTYKTCPICVFLHSQLDAFRRIIEANRLLPEDIDTVESYSIPFLANPAPYDVQTQVDVQFSLPSVFSAASIGLNMVAGSIQSLWDGAATFKLGQGTAARNGIFADQLDLSYSARPSSDHSHWTLRLTAWITTFAGNPGGR